MAKNNDWNDLDDTGEIRKLACSDNLDISYTKHARERLFDRGLIISDILHVLKNGFVHKEPQEATRGYKKYEIECRSPNSSNRSIKVVVIPDKKACFLKVITIMWADEK